MANEVGDALDKLVNQFSDPLSFFRELIQNAIDAGQFITQGGYKRRPSFLRIRPSKPKKAQNNNQIGPILVSKKDKGFGQLVLMTTSRDRSGRHWKAQYMRLPVSAIRTGFSPPWPG